MEENFVNFQDVLKNEYQKLCNVIQDYRNDPNVCIAMDNISALYQHKVVDLKPQIMVYGIYNAGKSSIINELIKEDRAKVADKPTTDEVTYYEWNGYKIADTPGVGAPIEHEQVTNNHLKQADVVLFVMSTTGSNEKAENYTRMKDIVDSGKKVIIILNDKNGDLGVNDETIQTIKMQVAENMRKVNIPDVEKKYCIVVVNADRAKKGRIESKPGLIQKSNISELERIILTELKSTDKFQVLKNIVTEIDKNISNIINTLQSYDEREELKQVNDILSSLREQKNFTRKNMASFIERKTNSLAHELPDIIWANKDNHEEMNKLVEERVKAVINKITRELENNIKDIQDSTRCELESLLENAKINDIDLSSIVDVSSFIYDEKLKDKSINNNISYKNDAFKEAFDKVIDILNENVVVDTVGNVAKKISVNKFIADKIGIIALPKLPIPGLPASIPPIAIPILQIIKIIYDIFKSNEEEERKRAEAENEYERRKAEAELQIRQELEQKCIYMADDLADELKDAVNKIIIDAFKIIEEMFTSKINETSDNINNKMITLNELRNISAEYNILCMKLTNN